MMKIIKITIGFLLGLLLSLIVLDQFVYYAQIEGTSPTDYDNIIGRKRRDNLNFTFFNEGFSMGSFNEYSYLGPTYHQQKEPNKFRIAVLGDSYVESFQVFYRDKFHRIIEKSLGERIVDSVEVLNFGRSGFDWADMYAYQKRMVAPFNPDMTIFIISDADLNCTQTDPLIPKVVYQDSTLVVTNDQMPRPYLATFERTKVLTQNSSLLTMLNNCRKLVKAGRFWPKILDKFYWQKEESSAVEPSMKGTYTCPILAYQILDQLSKNTIIINRGTDDLDSLFMHRIKDRGIPYIDIRDTLSVLISQGIDPNFWPVTKTRGHWNHQAHQAVGLFLSNKLERIIKEQSKNKNVLN